MKSWVGVAPPLKKLRGQPPLLPPGSCVLVCHRWRHRGHLRSYAFFVNNFRSNLDRELKKTLLWWMALSSRIDWYATWPPSSIHDLTGCDLTLTSEPTLALSFGKKKHHSTGLDERITMVLELWPRGHFWRSCEPKTKPRPLVHWPELWGHHLNWDLKFGHQSLGLVTADTLVFREALAQLGAKWRGVVPTPFSAGGRGACSKSWRLARVKLSINMTELWGRFGTSATILPQYHHIKSRTFRYSSATQHLLAN